MENKTSAAPGIMKAATWFIYALIAMTILLFVWAFVVGARQSNPPALRQPTDAAPPRASFHHHTKIRVVFKRDGLLVGECPSCGGIYDLVTEWEHETPATITNIPQLRW